MNHVRRGKLRRGERDRDGQGLSLSIMRRKGKCRKRINVRLKVYSIYTNVQSIVNLSEECGHDYFYYDPQTANGKNYTYNIYCSKSVVTFYLPTSCRLGQRERAEVGW